VVDGGREHLAGPAQAGAKRETRGTDSRTVAFDPAGRLREPLSSPAFRRHAPARGTGARTGGGRGHVAHGRALFGAGLPGAAAHAAGAGAYSARKLTHRRAGDARHRRSHAVGRPRGGAERAAGANTPRASHPHAPAAGASRIPMWCAQPESFSWNSESKATRRSLRLL
jgi:hypothetical protein